MPAVSDRPAVYKVAEYLRARPNQWVQRQEIGRKIGYYSKSMQSLLVTVCEMYPCIAEEDRHDGAKQVRLMWVDWDALS